MKNRLDSQVIANYRELVAAGEYLFLADFKLARNSQHSDWVMVGFDPVG